MIAYGDASFLVALFCAEPFTPAAERFIADHSPILIVSDFAAAEVALAVSRRVRMGSLTGDQANVVLSKLDAWQGMEATNIETTAGDMRAAASLVRRFDWNGGRRMPCISSSRGECLRRSCPSIRSSSPRPARSGPRSPICRLSQTGR